jgi:predicted heme/steroid binding protein
MVRVRTLIILSVVLVVAAWAQGVTALAVGSPPGGFVIPIGSTASFTSVQFGACNSLTWGYQLNGGANQNQFTFPGGCGSGSGPNVTIGPFATATTLRVFMTDNTCQFTTYYSDGTPVDHVIVSGSNPYSLRFSDAGGFCERQTTTANDFPGFNFHVDLAISDRSIEAAGTSVAAVEGRSFTGQVATFSDIDTNATAADYSASISWGDGSTSAGTITGGGGSFSVSGSHTYAEEGSKQVAVTITDTDNSSNSATTHSTATVTDAGLTASPACSATSLRSYNGSTATFVDAASPSGTLSDFSASISWGDGSASAGAVSGSNGGPYAVSGLHTYATTGSFTITTHITDAGGATAMTSCGTLGFSFAPGGGSFVIGGRQRAVGTSVTFWGAQWAKANSVSSAAAPRSFKGFADDPSVPTCGVDWSGDPGNSTPPPSGSLPAFMGVIVTDTPAKSGSTISGHVVHIVIVRTDPGYAPNPGHEGTGTVVATVC